MLRNCASLHGPDVTVPLSPWKHRDEETSSLPHLAFLSHLVSVDSEWGARLPASHRASVCRLGDGWEAHRAGLGAHRALMWFSRHQACFHLLELSRHNPLVTLGERK